MSINELLSIRIDEPDTDIYRRTKEAFDSLAKPLDGLGAFEEMICQIASIQRATPDISNKSLIIMCADNGVVAEGVTQTDSAVTASVARLMAEGKSTVGAMTNGYPVGIIPVDIGIDSDEKIEGIIDKRIRRGTGNIAKTAAMTEEECLAAINAGIGIVHSCRDKKVGILATGEMGIGNTTTATALFCALTGSDPGKITGRGAGLSDEGLARKTEVVRTALSVHGFTPEASGRKNVNAELAFIALSKLGGLDIAGLTGVYIGAAADHIPVVIDGAISAVAALAAHLIVPGCERYMLASHKGREKITENVLERLGLDAVISADMALGEGTGAVMLFPLLDMVMSLLKTGTRFTDTPIDNYRRYDK